MKQKPTSAINRIVEEGDTFVLVTPAPEPKENMSKPKTIQVIARRGLADDLSELWDNYLLFRKKLASKKHLFKSIENLFADQLFLNSVIEQSEKKPKVFHDLFKNPVDLERAINYLKDKKYIREKGIRNDAFDNSYIIYKITTSIGVVKDFIELLNKNKFFIVELTKPEIAQILVKSFSVEKPPKATAHRPTKKTFPSFHFVYTDL